jgi:plastocyanin
MAGRGVAAVLAALTLNACSGDSTGPAGVQALINCPQDQLGGDHIERGFYLASFPGSTLGTVRLTFSAQAAGAYDVALTARAGAYDGAVLGGDTVSLNFATAGESDTAQATFQLGDVAVTPGETVTFALSKVSGPDVHVYYGVHTSSNSCPVTQTSGTTAPLDVFRREGIAVRITGDQP